VGGTCHDDGLTENCQTSYQVEADRWQKMSFGSKQSKLTSSEEGLTGSKYLICMAVDREALRKLAVLCAISTVGIRSKV